MLFLWSLCAGKLQVRGINISYIFLPVCMWWWLILKSGIPCFWWNLRLRVFHSPSVYYQYSIKWICGLKIKAFILTPQLPLDLLLYVVLLVWGVSRLISLVVWGVSLLVSAWTSPLLLCPVSWVVACLGLGLFYCCQRLFRVFIPVFLLM